MNRLQSRLTLRIANKCRARCPLNCAGGGARPVISPLREDAP